MSEQELRDGLQVAVADEPPMAFDIDELVSTAERTVRRRRALVAVGAGTAAVALVAVAVPVALGISRGAPVEIPQAAPPTSATTSSSSTPSSKPKPPTLTKAELTKRGTEMQQYLRTRLPAVVPGVKQVNPGLFGGEAEGDIADGQQYLGSFVKFTLNAATAIEVHVDSRQDGVRENCPDCKEQRQPDGSYILTEVVRGPGGNDPQMTISSVTHVRNDGSLVRIATYNYDPTSGRAMAYQPDVALTVEQLTRLATDPSLHL